MYVYTQTATKYIGSSIITNNMVDVADNTRKDVYNSDDEDEEFEDLGNYEDINMKRSGKMKKIQKRRKKKKYL